MLDAAYIRTFCEFTMFVLIYNKRFLFLYLEVTVRSVTISRKMSDDREDYAIRLF